MKTVKKKDRVAPQTPPPPPPPIIVDGGKVLCRSCKGFMGLMHGKEYPIGPDECYAMDTECNTVAFLLTLDFRKRYRLGGRKGSGGKARPPASDRNYDPDGDSPWHENCIRAMEE